MNLRLERPDRIVVEFRVGNKRLDGFTAPCRPEESQNALLNFCSLNRTD